MAGSFKDKVKKIFVTNCGIIISRIMDHIKGTLFCIKLRKEALIVVRKEKKVIYCDCFCFEFEI